MIPTQMLKGILDNCILKVIAKEEVYGYEISEQLKKVGFSSISEGTIYPLLLRLEAHKYITTQYRASEVGPKRKYFSITPLGCEEMVKFHEQWQELETAVNALYREGREIK